MNDFIVAVTALATGLTLWWQFLAFLAAACAVIFLGMLAVRRTGRRREVRRG